MTQLRDLFWVWGHPAGSVSKHYATPGSSLMTPIEGALYFGARNLYFVPWADAIDIDQATLAADHLQEVGWSLEHGRVPGQLPDRIKTVDEELDYLAGVAAKYGHFKRVVFDDFFAMDLTGGVEVRSTHGGFAEFTPERLRAARDRLHHAANPLGMWMVVYSHQLVDGVDRYLQEFDGASLWFWWERKVADFEASYSRFLAATEGRRRQVGCYLFNFGDNKPATDTTVIWQLDRLREAILAGEIEGVILHTNAVGDYGYPAVTAAKSWLAEHGDEVIPGGEPV